ncbi:rRNA pseudouridine synthase [Halosquirtibacter laminarini]|uniref:rRNA pseudouridine synthase n=1 Tax=Halosquirtibacter laminarini TaxID=3374600 RepID=A0AC61NFB5_9BACT|nr:rRNA pseudouridine synthase [Prolixibacteraceae bacterium]
MRDRRQDRDSKRTVEKRGTGSGKRVGKTKSNDSSNATGRGRDDRNARKSQRTPRHFKQEEKESDKYLSNDGKVFKQKPNYAEISKGSQKRIRKNSNISTRTDDTIRLNRFIANAGICSRRDADTYIASGVVTVNGKVVTEMGLRVKPGDEVNFSGEKITAEQKKYVLLNKPKGFVTTVEDPHAEKTVMELVSSACKERLYPVGRLDKETTGLLLFTNDGDLTTRLTHPKYNRKKIYHVFCDKKVTKNHIRQILEGLNLEDGFVKADAVSYVDQNDTRQVGIEIHSGKNRIVRRIFSSLGYKVTKLDRVYFCGLTKLNLPRGKWRNLTTEEIAFLKMGNF